MKEIIEVDSRERDGLLYPGVPPGFVPPSSALPVYRQDHSVFSGREEESGGGARPRVLPVSRDVAFSSSGRRGTPDTWKGGVPICVTPATPPPPRPHSHHAGPAAAAVAASVS